MAGLFTALGTVSVFALVTGLVLLIINAIRRKPLKLWAFLSLGAFVLAIVSASIGAASRTNLPQGKIPLSSDISPTSSATSTETVTASTGPLPLPTTPKSSLTPKIARTPTPASPTPPSTKEKRRSLTKEETAWALSIQPKNRPHSPLPSWVGRSVGAYNSWYEEELYSHLSLKPPVEYQDIRRYRRYTLIGIKQTGTQPGKKKDIEVLLKVDARGEGEAQANFHNFRLMLAKPELWPTEGYDWNNLVGTSAIKPEPGYTPVIGVSPARVWWWPKGGLEVALFYDDALDNPFEGTPFEKAKEGIARLEFQIHIDTNITQKGAYLGGGSLKIDLDGLSEYLLKRD